MKQDVKSLINLVKVRRLREEAGLPVPPMSLHLVFLGNPGTGKTTVARLLARLYHAIGVLIICTLYLTRADRKRQCLAGAVLFLFELTAPLAFVLVWFYNGQRGACSPLLKKAFYWFYPVHLLVLAMITNLML